MLESCSFENLHPSLGMITVNSASDSSTTYFLGGLESLPVARENMLGVRSDQRYMEIHFETSPHFSVYRA